MKPIGRIEIEFIPHQEQRYDTAGDWFWKEDWSKPPGTEMGPSKLWAPVDVLVIRVSQLSDWRHSACVAVHELMEVLRCRHDGVTQAQVDKFDMAWKEHDGIDEPGDDPKAPYENQHNFAMGIEQLLAAALGVKWHEYEKELDALPEVETKK